MAMRMTGKTVKGAQKSATIDHHAPGWVRYKQLRFLLLVLSMLAVFLPAMPNASANEASTSLAGVLETIGADELHDLGVTGAGIDIAVIDTGVNAVAGLDGLNKVIHGPDLSFESGTEFYAQDTYGHGTAMASIIAGDGDGYQGVAPGARILSLKVADNTGAVDVSQVIAALDWVTQYGQGEGLNVRVINLAYVTPSTQPYEIDPLADAVERAWEAGYVVVVSAGNEGVSTGGLTSPATDPFVIAVAAAEGEGVADFSAAGTQRIPDVMAPGNRILALAALDSRLAQEHPDAIIDGRFLRGSGTSQAAAVVSGSAALLLQQRPDLTPDQVKALLITGAVHKRGNGNNGNSNSNDNGNGNGNANGNGNGRGPFGGIYDFFEATPADRDLDPTIMADLLDDVDTLFASWDGSGRGGIKFDKHGGSGMVDLARSAALPSLDVTQQFVRSDGSGTLEASRGGNHIVLPDGTILEGEVTFTGSSWTGSSWTGSSWTGSSWTGSSWTGSSWTGSSWTGSSWTGSSWTGSSWTNPRTHRRPTLVDPFTTTGPVGVTGQDIFWPC